MVGYSIGSGWAGRLIGGEPSLGILLLLLFSSLATYVPQLAFGGIFGVEIFLHPFFLLTYLIGDSVCCLT